MRRGKLWPTVSPAVDAFCSSHCSNWFSVCALTPSASPRRASREAAVAGWPAWLYQLYDVQRVAARAHADARRCLLCSAEAVPSDPVKLSYWVAMNLPIDDTYR